MNDLNCNQKSDMQSEILEELSLEMDIDICMAKESNCEDAY